MRFRISPDAFFQVNTPAAEVVYSLVKELCTTEKPPVIYGQFSTIVIGHCYGNRLFVLPSLLRLMEGLELSQLMRTGTMPTKYVNLYYSQICCFIVYATNIAITQATSKNIAYISLVQ